MDPYINNNNQEEKGDITSHPIPKEIIISNCITVQNIKVKAILIS